jgi:hypothetical protein
MSTVGPLGGVNVSAAGTALAQTRGSEVERASQDLGAQQRGALYEQKAQSAAGIGETDGEDHQTDERDADGRRPWEFPPAKKKGSANDSAAHAPKSRDASGQSGNLVDLSG